MTDKPPSPRKSKKRIVILGVGVAIGVLAVAIIASAFYINSGGSPSTILSLGQDNRPQQPIKSWLGSRCSYNLDGADNTIIVSCGREPNSQGYVTSYDTMVFNKPEELRSVTQANAGSYGLHSIVQVKQYGENDFDLGFTDSVGTKWYRTTLRELPQ